MEKKKQQIKTKAKTSSCGEGIGLWRQVVADVTPLKKNSATPIVAGTMRHRSLQTGSELSRLYPGSDFVEVNKMLLVK